MTYTKKDALHDRIVIDGVDMSNAFRQFGSTSQAEKVDVSGFSVSGTNEYLAGAKDQGFAGEMFVTPENDAFMRLLHDSGATFAVAWQKDGLVSSLFATEHALCQLLEYSPSATRGQPYTTPISFAVTDPNGITTS